MDKPSIFDRLKLARRVFREGVTRGPIQAKKMPFAWPSWLSGKPQWQIVDVETFIREGYSANTLIYSAINYKVRASYSAPMRAYTGDPENPEPLPLDHPLAAVVERPNPYQSKRAFLGQLLTYLNIAGNAYVLMAGREKDGPPAEMWCLRPDRVFIIPEEGKRVKGYMYVPEGKAVRDGVPILSQDIAHVKFPNPADPLEGLGYGLSPLAPLAKSADVDNSITAFLKIFFDKGTMPMGVLKFDNPIDDKTLGDIKRRWMEMYGSYENWADVGVLDQGGSYEPITPSFSELGFAEIDERNESRVLGPFGVPGILIGTRVGLAHSTYSNFEEARKQFWEDTFVPELSLVEDELAYFLQADGGDAFARFDLTGVPALRANTPALLTAFMQGLQSGLTRNQLASLLELEIGEDLVDGDVAYMPFSLQPIGPDAPPPAAEIQGQVQPDGTIVGKPKPKPAPAKPGDTNAGAPDAQDEAGQIGNK